MSILCIDFMNQAHRARSGFQMGPAPVVFNFFRQFKSLVDQFKPSRVYVVLEGKPVDRYELLPEYKANRKVTEDDPKYAELQKFFEQKNVIVDLLSKYFPVSVVRHPTSECDDTIANLISRSSTAVPWTVVSNDSDFTQLLNSYSHVSIWNPIKKQFVMTPEYDYVTWKALRGDGGDNIPGIPGCGDGTALKLVNDPDALGSYLKDPTRAEIFARNYELISFQSWSEDERMEMTSTSPEKNWSVVKDMFDGYGFKSMIKEDTWQKFTSSFEHLWG